ncbi:hypothetical protein EWM64_g2676 [Hericium alpestre]|uniref:Cytochrome P450 n=1 Tax=Hericium alpestre TaxID=135208 RepID=A0A4Z0A2S7_9AGAM|nr:hypothetical protein EWM64_g2676 [Hericium alpestre]
MLTLAHIPLPSATAVLVASITSLTAYLLSPLFTLLIQNLRSPLRLLPGPPSASFFAGNLADFADQENNVIISQWTALYGRTLVYRGFLGGRRLLTTDPAALAWILGHAYEFPKPEFVRESLAAMAAGHEGLVVVEGETHRRQRKIMNQAFTTPHIKSLAPIFYEKACELRDIFIHLVSAPPKSPSPASPPTSQPQYNSFSFLCSLDPVRPVDGHLRRRSKQSDEEHGGKEESEGVEVKGGTEANKPPSVDVLSWLGRATLDVIGEAGKSMPIYIHRPSFPPFPHTETPFTTGFGYQFNSLRTARRAAVPNADPFQGENTAENELANAFGVIFSTARKFRVFTIFQVWFPILRRFVSVPPSPHN